ncbi:unannotated protein [freshwater metagenome]|uniref:Unannotated protein n=1 Tax=freshwater metagenome TaxID=449393 RepID=A0A6J6WGN0_9ZZZZ
MSAPVRSAHIASWSAAAARKVSPAARTTERPLDTWADATLPIVVVLPTPFTPTKSQTATRLSSAVALRERSPASRRATNWVRRAATRPSGAPLILRCSRICCVVVTPTSLRSSTSSTRSSCSVESEPRPLDERTRSKTPRLAPRRPESESSTATKSGRAVDSSTKIEGSGWCAGALSTR